MRPSKEELFDEIKNETFEALSRKYGVSDTCIRKWCKFYGLPSTKYELNGNTEKPKSETLKCSYCGKEFKVHDKAQIHNKTHFCCTQHKNEYKKKLTLANVDGSLYEITKELILQEGKKYSSISEMAKNLSISRFLLARRIKEYCINTKLLFKSKKTITW